MGWPAWSVALLEGGGALSPAPPPPPPTHKTLPPRTPAAGLENDEYVRQTDGYLPTSEVAFVDEIFKANSAILNSLLTVRASSTPCSQCVQAGALLCLRLSLSLSLSLFA